MARLPCPVITTSSLLPIKHTVAADTHVPLIPIKRMQRTHASITEIAPPATSNVVAAILVKVMDSIAEWETPLHVVTLSHRWNLQTRSPL